ncbi:MAG: hypothetical protein Q9209_006308 [Squamulea sp. 1 TL-2023]
MSDQRLSGIPEAFKHAPLASAPPGVVQNLENPQSRTYQLWIVSAVFVALSVSFMIVRLYAKLFIQRSRTWDDYACLAALAGIISYTGVTIASMSQPGAGKHLWDTVISDYSDQGFIESVVSTAIYGPVIFLVKLALFLLYLHLFGRLRWLKLLVWGGIVFTGLFYIPAIFIAFILCGPSKGETWLDRSMTSKCRHGAQDYGVAHGTINVLSDFYLLIIPIPAVLSLKMPMNKKIGVIAIFMTGFFTCIVSTVALGLRIIYNKSLDITWNVVTLYIMTIVEMNVGLMVACMPSVATVFKHHGGCVASFFGSLSAKFRSRSSQRGRSEKYKSNKSSPDSSVDGGRPYLPKMETYAELRVGPGAQGIMMPGPVV